MSNNEFQQEELMKVGTRSSCQVTSLVNTKEEERVAELKRTLKLNRKITVTTVKYFKASSTKKFILQKNTHFCYC